MPNDAAFFEISTLGEPGRDDYAFLERVDLGGIERYRLNDGESVRAQFKSAKATLREGPETLAALLGNTSNLLIVKREVKEAIEKICSDVQLECLPLHILDAAAVKTLADDYFIVHPVGQFEGINPVASKVKYHEDGVAHTYDVILDMEKVKQAPSLFRVPEAATTFIMKKSTLQELNRQLADKTNIYMKPIPCVAGKAEDRYFPQSGALITTANAEPSPEKHAAMKALLAAGADPNVECDGETAMAHAIAKDDLVAIAMLLDAGADPNRKTEDDYLWPLAAVARTGSRQALDLLLARGADVSKAKECCRKPLLLMLVESDSYTAAHTNQIIAIMDGLVRSGASLDDSGENSPLGSAIWGKRDDSTTRLIELGADVNAPSGHGGRRPLHMASAIGASATILELLLAKGADLNAKDDNGGTPLDCASSAEVIALLQTAGGRGIPPEPPVVVAPVTDAQKKTAIAMAKRFSHHSVAYRAMAMGKIHVDDPDGTGQPFLHVLCQDDIPEEVQAFVEQLGGDPTVAGRMGLQPLHQAIQCGAERVAAYLLTKVKDLRGADNAFGATFMHFACQGEPRVAILRALLEAGAECEVDDKAGFPPLALALRQAVHAHVELLLSHGANVDRKWPTGYTGREIIAEHGDEKMKELLARMR